MIRRAAVRAVEAVLRVPVFFELQQRLFNDYERVREEFRDFLDRDGISVLDVGCSTGACAGAALDMSRCEYVGIDIVPEYVALARESHPEGRFLVMDARRMAFGDATFDVVMFIGAMHHMEDGLVRDCLRDIRRVLKPDGAVLVGEPVFTRGRPLSTLLLSLDRGRHIRDEDGYRALLGGFRVERDFRLSVHRFRSFVLRKEP